MEKYNVCFYFISGFHFTLLIINVHLFTYYPPMRNRHEWGSLLQRILHKGTMVKESAVRRRKKNMVTFLWGLAKLLLSVNYYLCDDGNNVSFSAFTGYILFLYWINSVIKRLYFKSTVTLVFPRHLKKIDLTITSSRSFFLTWRLFIHINPQHIRRIKQNKINTT